jgi:hypothetical protein
MLWKDSNIAFRVDASSSSFALVSSFSSSPLLLLFFFLGVFRGEAPCFFVTPSTFNVVVDDDVFVFLFGVATIIDIDDDTVRINTSRSFSEERIFIRFFSFSPL